MYIKTVLLSLLLVVLQTIVIDSTSLAEDSSRLVAECVEKPYGYKIVDPSDCHGYFLCHGEMVFQQYCAPGSKFVKDIQDCIVGKCPPCPCSNDVDEMTATALSMQALDHYTPDCTKEKDGSLLPDDFHCRIFWTCDNVRAIRQFCPLGLWFDREQFICAPLTSVKNCPAMQN